MTRVKVEYEGELLGPSALQGRVRIMRNDGQVVQPREEYVTIIEPEYEGGEIYTDAHGVRYYRRVPSSDAGNAWRRVITGDLVSHDVPKRPLRKMVPEVTT